MVPAPRDTNVPVVVLSASPWPGSRPDWLGDYVSDELVRLGCRVHHLRVRDLPACAVWSGDSSDPQVVAACTAVADADGIVLITPIYRAAYSGLLKIFLDTLPRHALAGKTVLPLATGGSRAHVLALDYALRPVVQAMGADHVERGHFVHDEELPREMTTVVPNPETLTGVAAAVSTFRTALTIRARHADGAGVGRSSVAHRDVRLRTTPS